MKIFTATEARRDLFTLLKRSVHRHEQFRITHTEGDAVLLSQEDVENLLETVKLLATPGLLKSVRRARREIAQGETCSLEEVLGAR